MIKTIMIKRREPSTRIAKEISSDIILKIGGCLTATGTPLKGLTFDEEEKYLPQIVGIPKEHLEFTTRVDNWYNKMSINIPYLGCKFAFWELIFTHHKLNTIDPQHERSLYYGCQSSQSD